MDKNDPAMRVPDSIMPKAKGDLIARLSFLGA